MQFPENLKYTKTHEWVKEITGGTIEVGLSDYAQKEMGDLVFVNLPQEGDGVTAGETFADVESVKAVSEVYCPVSGIVCAVNEELMDTPESINSAPYEAWFVRIEQISGTEDLMSAEEYEAFIESENQK
ncbi:MAG: glycine cleavage system protein GcvH [Herbinix sp.]|nr:glycine cleavage system protein GcvH [Herbinix sp.]